MIFFKYFFFYFNLTNSLNNKATPVKTELALSSGATENNGGKTYLVLAGDITDEEAVLLIDADLGVNTQFVKVTSTTNLTSLDFTGYDLDNLVEVSITDNENLQSVSFHYLVNVWETLNCSDNSVLSVVSCPKLDIAGYLGLRRNGSLSQLMCNLSKVRSIEITYNSFLTFVSFLYT